MSDCGITNLGSCLVEKFFEFLIYILNQPIRPLLDMVDKLLTEPVNIEIFTETWVIIIYILSLFYGILLLITGFRFLLSGHSVEQREKAKRSLSNIILMMIFIQISFFLYELILKVISAVSTVIFNLIRDDFFLITMDSITNIGLELVLLLPYIMTLVITLIFLVLRYICVGIGVIFFAIGIFFYFVEPLNQYGKLILNYLFVIMSLPFFYSIVFLASSKFLELSLFRNMKIIVMIGAFSLVNLLTVFLILFVIIKAANALAGPIGTVAKVAGALA
ncbi:hypothetical protein KAS08_02325 [Candidatus Pacearchaeota archaeon]|nr:hypothetical protein [Candidatus Pacearchaeota archaeon]